MIKCDYENGSRSNELSGNIKLILNGRIKKHLILTIEDNGYKRSNNQTLKLNPVDILESKEIIIDSPYGRYDFTIKIKDSYRIRKDMLVDLKLVKSVILIH